MSESTYGELEDLNIRNTDKLTRDSLTSNQSYYFKIKTSTQLKHLGDREIELGDGFKFIKYETGGIL